MRFASFFGFSAPAAGFALLFGVASAGGSFGAAARAEAASTTTTNAIGNRRVGGNFMGHSGRLSRFSQRNAFWNLDLGSSG
jgi:hypothetical protein